MLSGRFTNQGFEITRFIPNIMLGNKCMICEREINDKEKLNNKGLCDSCYVDTLLDNEERGYY